MNCSSWKVLARAAGRVWLLLLVLTVGSRAQTPAAPRRPTPAADLILRLDGQEISGRVLLITPTELRYLPVPPTGPDTLRLPAAEVFLVRFANGTKEILNQPTVTPPAAAPALNPEPAPLVGLTAGQRWVRGQADARRYYRGSAVFWGSAGATALSGPFLGLAAPVALTFIPVRPRNFSVPEPQLLQDVSYARGYQRQANRRKTGNAWGGYGVVTGAYVVLIVSLLASLH